jgi:hypothetical protein
MTTSVMINIMQAPALWVCGSWISIGLKPLYVQQRLLNTSKHNLKAFILILTGKMDLGLDIDSNDTEELRHHIHHLLRDYSRIHLTTNYIDFTEDLVSEVWISLFITRFLLIVLFLSLSMG